MGIAPDRFLVADDQSNILTQKLFVHTTTEKCHHRDIKFFVIHVVDQVDENLFCATMAKVMDKEQDFQKGQHLSFC